MRGTCWQMVGVGVGAMDASAVEEGDKDVACGNSKGGMGGIVDTTGVICGCTSIVWLAPVLEMQGTLLTLLLVRPSTHSPEGWHSGTFRLALAA